MRTEKYLMHRIDVVFVGVDETKPYTFEVYHSTTGRRLNLRNENFASISDASHGARKFIDDYESGGAK